MRPNWIAMLVIFLMTGCNEPPDARIEQITRQALDQQARQNEGMAEQGRQSARTAEKLVEADARAREEVVRLQREVVERDAEGRQQLAQLSRQAEAAQAEQRARLDDQRARLDDERRQLALERRRAPIIATTLAWTGTMLACLLPLALAGYVLYLASRRIDEHAVVSDLLVQELTSQHPRLLPPARGPMAIGHDPTTTADQSDSREEE